MNLLIFENLGNKEEKVKFLEETFKINAIEKQLILKYDFVTKPVLNSDMEYILGCKHITDEKQCTIQDGLNWLKDDIRNAANNCYKSFKKFEKLPQIKQIRLIAFSFNMGAKFIEFKKIIEECK